MIEWVSDEEAGTYNKEFFCSIEEQKAFFRELIIDLMTDGNPAAKAALENFIQAQNNKEYTKETAI